MVVDCVRGLETEVHLWWWIPVVGEGRDRGTPVVVDCMRG